MNYSNKIKNQLQQFDIRAYNPQDLDEVVELLTDSYMQNDPFLQPLKFTREQMILDFRNQLLDNSYDQGVIMVDKETKEIAAVSFFTTLKKLKINIDADITKVPTKSLTKKYIMHSILAKLIKGEKFEQDKIHIGSNNAVKTKYKNTGLGNLLQYVMVQALRGHGFKMGVGIYISDQVKEMVKKHYKVDKAVSINLEDVQIEDTSEVPFKGLGLKYEAYLFIHANQPKL